MKRLLSAFSTAFLLAGCAFSPSWFDSNEQSRITDIVMMSSNPEVCADNAKARGNAIQLHDATAWLVVYGSMLPNNEKLVDAYKNLDGITSDFARRYTNETPSATYCKLKLKNINEASNLVLSTSGRRPRP